MRHCAYPGETCKIVSSPLEAGLAPSPLAADDQLEQAWAFAMGYLRERYLSTTILDFSSFNVRLEENFAQRVGLSVEELQRAALILQADSDVDAAELMRQVKQAAPAASMGLLEAISSLVASSHV